MQVLFEDVSSSFQMFYWISSTLLLIGWEGIFASCWTTFSRCSWGLLVQFWELTWVPFRYSMIYLGTHWFSYQWFMFIIFMFLVYDFRSFVWLLVFCTFEIDLVIFCNNYWIKFSKTSIICVSVIRVSVLSIRRTYDFQLQNCGLQCIKYRV